MTDPRTPPSHREALLVPGTVVAGYRLIRQLSGAAGTVAWLAQSPGNETLCITVQSCAEAAYSRVAAHSRVSSPYVQALVDIATDTDGRIVLASERTDWTLATLLSSRASLALGEAVTVLAPVVAGVAAIHQEGLCHGGLTPATVLFCPDGRPVIGGLETLRDSAEEAHDASLPPGVRADYRALGCLVTAAASVVDDAARSELAAVAEWIESQLEEDSVADAFLGQVECRLFALAPALPAVLVADRSPGNDTGHRLDRRASEPPVGSVRRASDILPALAVLATTVDRSGIGAWTRRVLRGRALAVCLWIALLVAALLAGLAVIPDRVAGSVDVVRALSTTEKRQPVFVLGVRTTPAGVCVV